MTTSKEGQELINLEDIGILKIDFRLPEAYLGQIKPGQAVEATSDALPGQKFEAVLDAIDPLSTRAAGPFRAGRICPMPMAV